jgi:hypothetical protein
VVNSHPLCQLSYPGTDFFISNGWLFCQLDGSLDDSFKVSQLSTSLVYRNCFFNVMVFIKNYDIDYDI